MSSNAVLSTSASSALGTVIMGTQYNALDPPFSDKRTMENYEFTNSCSPDKCMMHPIECKMNQTSVAELYIRTGEVTSGDLRLYDLGNFQIATQGMQGTTGSVCGELWCTFEIEFFKPKLLTGNEGLVNSDHYNADAPIITPTNSPLGGVTNPTSGSSIMTHLVQESGYQAIIFPPDITSGMYLLSYSCQGSTDVGGPFSVISPKFLNATNGAMVLGYYDNATAQCVCPNTVGTGAAGVQRVGANCIFNITAGGASIGLEWDASTGNTLLAGSVKADLYITKLDPDCIAEP